MNNEPIIEEEETLDDIMDFLYDAVLHGHPLTKQVWLDKALKMTVLSQDVDDKIAEGKMYLAKLDSKRKRIVEIVRIAKKQVDIKDL